MKRVAFATWYVSGIGYEILIIAMAIWGTVWAIKNPDTAIKAGLLVSVASGLFITFWGLS